MVCRERFALGAYLLGSLDPAEHSAVGRHVVRCADCRAELLELAPLVELLRHLPFAEAPQPGWSVQSPGPVAAAPRHAPALEPGRTAGALSRVARRARVRRALLGCALVVAAAGVGVGIHLGAGARQPAAVRPGGRGLRRRPGHPCGGIRRTHPDLTGTSIRLRVSGLPPAACRLVVRARDGRVETVAYRTSGYDAAITVPGSASFGVRDLARSDAVIGRGLLLAELRPR